MRRYRDTHLNLTQRGRAFGPRSRFRGTLPILIFVSVALLLLSRLNHTAIADMRWRMAEIVGPALEAALRPLEPIRSLGRRLTVQVDAADRIQRLQTENQKLGHWEWRARDLERKLADLETLSKVADAPRLAFVTSRVIANSSGAFVRSILIDAGSARDVRIGYPVIGADGLVGRIVETGEALSRVMLATDASSRIPVTVGANGVRAILAGDNGPEPRLIYMPGGSAIAPGDDVATSGAGGVFPRGLRIGTVSSAAQEPRVALRARLDMVDYVSVLFFEDLSRTVAPPDRQARAPGAKR